MTQISVVAGGTASDVLTVRHLRASGPDRHLGSVLAEAARQVHGSTAGPLSAQDPIVQRARRQWFVANHPVLAERQRGISDVFDVDPDDDRWDLGMLGTYEVPAGCSAVFFPKDTTRDGHALLARNFDFPLTTFSQLRGLSAPPSERILAADPWVVELHPDDGYSSLVIGIMDVLGGMDGINSQGLVVSLLADDESPDPEPSGRPQVGLSEQQIVRFLLDTCSTVDEAKQALLLAKQYYLFVPCHFLVADPTGRAFVWEYSPGHNIEHIVDAVPDRREALVCTNHLLHRWPPAWALPDDQRSGVAGQTYQRWAVLDSRVTTSCLVDPDAAREHLAAVAFTAPDPAVRTLWNVVYDLASLTADVSFYLRDHEGRSQYSPPVRFALN